MGNHYRKISKSDLYHVMCRGVNKQKIFEDDNDKTFYLNLLKKLLKTEKIQIHAYCLMDNHFHILLKSKKDEMSLFMQKLLSSYARYFNHKTGRIGHLFESRYRSESIEDDKYYITVVRYILQNPEKAMICKTEKYKWSSFGSYMKNSFVNTDYILKLFVNKTLLFHYLLEKNFDECLDVALNPEEQEIRAQLIINHICKPLGNKRLKELPKERRDAFLQEIKRYGVSVRKISKITDIGINIVQRA